MPLFQGPEGAPFLTEARGRSLPKMTMCYKYRAVHLDNAIRGAVYKKAPRGLRREGTPSRGCRKGVGGGGQGAVSASRRPRWSFSRSGA